MEHSAILETCKALEQEGYSVTYLKPDKNGDITASQVESALRDDTALVTMMLVNNETGCIFPVAEVAQLLQAKKSRALLHTDLRICKTPYGDFCGCRRNRGHPGGRAVPSY